MILRFNTMNAKIRNAREKALAVLKPSKKDLEHGLALHKESIVFDAYGFAPSSSTDGAALGRLRDDGASSAELSDSIEKMLMTRHLFNSLLIRKIIRRHI